MFKKFTRKELILYFLALVIAILGLVFMILGLVADNLSVGNTLDLFQQKMAIPLRFVGLIIFACALIFFLIVTLVFAKQVDRVIERETRRKQRLEAMLNDNDSKERILVKDGKVINEEKKEDSDDDIELKSIDEKDKF